jgi:hypothetical protein
VLKGEAGLEDNDVFIEWNGTSAKRPVRSMAPPEIDRANSLTWRSVVSGRWKLNLCAGDQCELFNLETDPYEQSNLFNDLAQRDRVSDLADRIRSWQQRTGDNVPLPAV